MILYLTYKNSGKNDAENKGSQEMKKFMGRNRPKLMRSVSDFPRVDKLMQTTYAFSQQQQQESNDNHI